ncbi:response regulator [Nitrospirillum viridazoti]|uniref:Response regulator n=2 Tax=Nitrospirillum TaxID=1543705 RepID=A0A248JQ41_9PROT|nr:response regulator [Nitrospirillum amazonense]ASG20815.1 response regulator [Nitrospirillum amazonense CBAmc]EGY01527.1 response regulator receiver domain protein [Nitrospirillum amazonense Y2]TWB37847.1 response regulator receiver domain-containing protein [Nitrospirillum amazonense]TWB63347.1 response regulator receiver domain-containing protein [Nitrospirillum amazonense]
MSQAEINRDADDGDDAAVRLMIVEDDALVALGIRLTVEDLGYYVCGIAASEPEAIALAASSHPDLALMDIRLKGTVDGIDTARRLRNEFSLRSVFLSAYTDEQTMARASLTYPLGFVQKPYSAGQLKSALDLALRRLAAPRD